MAWFRRLSDNVLVQYTVVVFITVALLSVAVGLVLQQQLRNVLIESRLEVYPRLIRTETENHPYLLQYLARAEPRQPPEDVHEFLSSVSKAFGASRLKLWSRDNTVLWSDDEDIVGDSFPENAHLNEALAGELQYEIESPSGKSENLGEAGLDIALEVYAPVSSSGTVVGALEMYIEDAQLASEIRGKTVGAWLSVLASGLLLYGLLFLIFYNSYRKQRRTERQLIAAHDATIFSLAHQAELRDQETGEHLQRTAAYVHMLAKGLRRYGELKSYLTDGYIADLMRAAPLHDIGKVAISDVILLKPGPLTEEERLTMQRHTEYGADTLSQIEERLGFQSFIRIAVEIARHHHERWDGAGYPGKLAGDDIPLSARIMALADVYDALRSERPYKESMSHEESRDLIVSGRGTQFDPAVVDAFLAYEKQFASVSTFTDEGVGSIRFR